MITFLTSSPGDSYVKAGKWIPCELNGQNGFVDNLKKYWKDESRCLIISSDPNNQEMNDSVKDVLTKSFALSGLPFADCEICDTRNSAILEAGLAGYDMLILAGGHVPTQNAFFQQIELRDKIQQFDGIIIGISAGTMNSADLVYAQPELPGEAIDPAYQRFMEGLGITDIMVLPHFQEVRNEILDGKRVIEDITYEDSIGRQFYALVDGSYIIVTDRETRLYGEGYLIADADMKQICTEGEMIIL